MHKRLLRTGLMIVLFSLVTTIGSWAQHTFRGGVNGSVTDQSGAAIPGAAIEVTNTGTNAVLKTASTSSGDYVFPELAPGKYTLVVTAPGFQSYKITGLNVSAGATFTQPVKMTVASSSETVEVAADAYTMDTTTTTQTTIIDSEAVADAPLNGRDFTQMASLTPGFANSGAGGYGSLNGTRANQINWQIDGVDNNDIWHNIPAVNQGGVSGIAGVILPIDAVEQFSVQTNASADSGRNPGGTVTLGLKGGGNTLHGSAYYYNRNELFGAKSPFHIDKQKVRNYNAGFSVGGPVRKDKLFYFVNYEQQRFVIGVPAQTTEPTDVWVGYAQQLLDAKAKATAATSDPFSATPNSVTTALRKALWPSKALKVATESTLPVINNYSSNDPEYGYSYNGVAKIDYTLSANDSVSAHFFGGQGNQVAPIGSKLLAFYEVAPIHVQNWQATWNHTMPPNLTNQVVAGVNYFNQIFGDNSANYNVSSTGLVDGSMYNSNAPKIEINGFDKTGMTPPEGRQDITGQISDNLTWVKGKHQAKFGGEFRRVQLDEFYHRNAQGDFQFSGTEGGWDNYISWLDNSSFPSTLQDAKTGGSYFSKIEALADFLSGNVASGKIAWGDPERLVYVHTLSFFAADAFQVTPKLNVNYGVRWDYEGPLHDDKKDLSVFRPDLGGIVFQGDKISNVYDPTYTDFSPRVGFSYQLTEKTVLRGGAGIYFDTPNINPFLDNRPGNGAPNGLEGNPSGSSPVFTINKSNFALQSGVNPFGDATTPTCTGGSSTVVGSPCGVFSVAKNFQPSNNINLNLQVERSFGANVIAQIGYVGSIGHHLLSLIDLNQAPGNTITDEHALYYHIPLQYERPYFSKFPQYSYINEIQSIGNSNYHSLQATLRTSNWKHLSTQVAYTYSHAFDNVTAYRGSLPQDSKNFKGDYGATDFDYRQILVGSLTYEVPALESHKLITGGWQLNSSFSFHTGMPMSILTDSQKDYTGEGNQRANLTGVSPYKGYKKATITMVDGNLTGSEWLNSAAFTDPDQGSWGTTARNQFITPGFGDVDLSIFKNTKIVGRLNTQLRVEFYNLFNRINFAPPVNNFDPNQSSPSSLRLSDTIGDFNGAPGIGAGEPFNTQLAFKVTF